MYSILFIGTIVVGNHCYKKLRKKSNHIIYIYMIFIYYIYWVISMIGLEVSMKIFIHVYTWSLIHLCNTEMEIVMYRWNRFLINFYSIGTFSQKLELLASLINSLWKTDIIQGWQGCHEDEYLIAGDIRIISLWYKSPSRIRSKHFCPRFLM